MMVKYSVIVPIYNSEKTLSRCIDSLVRQGRNDVQIILVNDGSTDHTEEIALQYAEKYPGIDYLFQKNAGVSCARNVGIEHARGTYITFVDSDDYVANDYFSTLDQVEDCDLLVFAHETVGGAPLEEAALFKKLQGISSFEGRFELLLASRKIMSPWNKRFRTALIRKKELRFLSGMHTGEDFNFCMAYTVCCKTIETISEKIVCVDISDQDSLSRRYRPELDKKLRIVFEQVAETIRDSDLYEGLKGRLLAITDYLFMKHIFSCIAEEFKDRKLKYYGNKRWVGEICNSFQQPISDRRCNVMHFALRLALKWKLYFLFYFVSYWAKGRKYRS